MGGLEKELWRSEADKTELETKMLELLSQVKMKEIENKDLNDKLFELWREADKNKRRNDSLEKKFAVSERRTKELVGIEIEKKHLEQELENIRSKTGDLVSEREQGETEKKELKEKVLELEREGRRNKTLLNELEKKLEQSECQKKELKEELEMKSNISTKNNSTL
ncbi:calponin homology domain-containing protein-like isoform X2 [Prunus yedoensis var. nudiflora]|uniref:Calponin homology domain-containing protein-like isoform X2 n=1 Tax=Prunus yedoensis var. nudiflora TaxID=2094558 RepID=A0A314Z1I1_PRUYE|nr:calponin homology domain-containing protein-like isoform X2 [Prunus yedoensis var. nudiflora]